MELDIAGDPGRLRPPARRSRRRRTVDGGHGGAPGRRGVSRSRTGDRERSPAAMFEVSMNSTGTGSTVCEDMEAGSSSGGGADVQAAQETPCYDLGTDPWVTLRNDWGGPLLPEDEWKLLNQVVQENVMAQNRRARRFSRGSGSRSPIRQLPAIAAASASSTVPAEEQRHTTPTRSRTEPARSERDEFLAASALVHEHQSRSARCLPGTRAGDFPSDRFADLLPGLGTEAENAGRVSAASPPGFDIDAASDSSAAAALRKANEAGSLDAVCSASPKRTHRRRHRRTDSLNDGVDFQNINKSDAGRLSPASIALAARHEMEQGFVTGTDAHSRTGGTSSLQQSSTWATPSPTRQLAEQFGMNFSPVNGGAQSPGAASGPLLCTEDAGAGSDSDNDATAGSSTTLRQLNDALSLSGSGLKRFRFSSDMRRCITQLDLSNNFLQIDSLDVQTLSYSWLRDLNISGNHLKRFPRFTRPILLLRLNLADNNELDTIPRGFAASVPQLRELNVEGCALATLVEEAGSACTDVSEGNDATKDRSDRPADACALRDLPHLAILNVARNALPLEGLRMLLQVRTLKQLDLRHNPGCLDPAYHKGLQSVLFRGLPQLESLDGDGPGNRALDRSRSRSHPYSISRSPSQSGTRFASAPRGTVGGESKVEASSVSTRPHRQRRSHSRRRNPRSGPVESKLSRSPSPSLDPQLLKQQTSEQTPTPGGTAAIESLENGSGQRSQRRQHRSRSPRGAVSVSPSRGIGLTATGEKEEGKASSSVVGRGLAFEGKERSLSPPQHRGPVDSKLDDGSQKEGLGVHLRRRSANSFTVGSATPRRRLSTGAASAPVQ